MKINDFSVQDFSGGTVRNKSDYAMNANEFRETRNFDVDERGRLIRRRGFMVFGTDTGAFSVDSVIPWELKTLGATSTSFNLVVERDATANVWKIISTILTSNVAVGDATINVNSTVGFESSGVFEVEGDEINYTGTTATTFTGCTNIRVAHASNVTAHQTVLVASATALNASIGCYSAVLNNVLFLNGTGGSFTFDGTNVTAVSDADEPAGLFATNYRDRIYVAGDGTADASGTRNGSRIRVSFSDAGDATSWDISNFFDVEDQSGEDIVGLKVHKDRLFIFKPNSTFSFDEVQMKRSLVGVGAYNYRVIVEIDGVIYTACPSGVFTTNGFSAKKISQPVEEYLKQLRPVFGSSQNRVILNTYAWSFEKKYHLFIGNITSPETMNNVVLVYDTTRGNWTVYEGFASLNLRDGNIMSAASFNDADQTSGGGQRTSQKIEAVFGTDDSGQIFRFFDNTAITNLGLRSGGDIVADNVDDSAGTPISCVLETPFYDFNSNSWKRIGYFRLLSERGSWNVFYRLDKGDRITDWIPLGEFNATNMRKRLKEQDCFRIAFKITGNQSSYVGILNGFSVEDIERIDDTR